MINFLLGFLTADVLFDLIFYFKKEVILNLINLDKNILLLHTIVDISFILLLLIIKYVKSRKS